MAEQKQKRTRRTPEAKAAEIDKKIEKLLQDKENLFKPAKVKKIIEEASKKYSVEEIAKRLEIEI